jgi:hypothetical protein
MRLLETREMLAVEGRDAAYGQTTPWTDSG